MWTALRLAMGVAPVSAQQAVTDPLLSENAVRQVSPHVHVIMGFPNIGMVVGERGILVVDTGLGDRNGALLAREAARLAHKGQKLYLTTTHFHPEHASGQGGFPPGTTVIRARVQQAEFEADGARMYALFSGRSPQMQQLLAGAQIGKADVLFDREYDLDLGGVHARLLAFGAAHTQGDEIIFVPEDSLILPGDVVENRISPNIICADCSPRRWIAVLDQIAPLKPKHVVPDHGDLGDGSLIAQERAFLNELQVRSMALKAEGKTAAEAGRIVAEEFAAEYAGWTGLGNVPQSVARAYADMGVHAAPAK
jgi:glyoxylase-like metal-dependent hydrolase (beta-lactamase superfamily II)